MSARKARKPVPIRWSDGLDYCDLCGVIIGAFDTQFGMFIGDDENGHDHVLCDRCGRHMWRELLRLSS